MNNFEQCKKMKAEGKKVPSKMWKALTAAERKQLLAQAGRDSVNKAGSTPDTLDQDWRWYALTEQIAKDIASYPYNIIPGVQHGVEYTTYVLDTAVSRTKFEGGVNEQSVLALNYVPSCGVATRRTDGVNMAATELYTFTRRANSGARNYEAADEMMYVLAMADIYEEYLHLRKAIGLASLYDMENHNLPDLLINAMGLNPSELRGNLAGFRAQLNILASKINALAVPKYFRIFERIAFVASNVFMDSNSKRGQYYIYNKLGYYRWTPLGSTVGTMLEFFYHTTSSTPFASRLEKLQDTLDALFLDDDANTISGDILKAFGSDALYAVMETPENFVTVPAFQEDALAQIENSITYETFFAGSRLTTEALDIKQSNQLITWQPFFTASAAVGETTVWKHIPQKYFNSHKDDPDYRDNLDWTRLMHTWKFKATPTDTVMSAELDSCGRELLETYTMFKNTNAPGGFTAVTFGNYIGPESVVAALEVMQYDWHPFLYNISGTEFAFAVGGDIKKYTILPDSIIRATNTAANVAVLWGDDLYKIANKPDVNR